VRGDNRNVFYAIGYRWEGDAGEHFRSSADGYGIRAQSAAARAAVSSCDLAQLIPPGAVPLVRLSDVYR